jgi:hypothetical protein
VPAQDRIEFPKQPRNRRDPQDNSQEEGERHSEEDFPESVNPGISPAAWKYEVERFLTFFAAQVRKAISQALGLIRHRFKDLPMIQAIEPFEIPGTKPAGAVVDHHRAHGSWGHIISSNIRII